MDTRKTPRAAAAFKAKLKVDLSVKQYFNIAKRSIDVEIIDISTGGAGLSSKYFIPKGVNILLEFMISDQLIKVKGEVRSVNLKGKGLTRLGIKFTDIDEKDKQVIEKFAEENRKKE
ncbi:MAG: PilZ domain-containing protein [Candidatus Aureabacteria bacterium]|nr:PilZ domain-containing protein [Candidatus Auribacterota bacterium]